jgi:hypothetical protein
MIIVTAIDSGTLSRNDARDRISAYRKSTERHWKRVDELESGKHCRLVVDVNYPPSEGLGKRLYELGRIRAIVRLGKDQALSHWLGTQLAEDVRSTERQREGGGKGGRKSGTARRRLSNMAAVLRAATTMLATGTPHRGLARKLHARFPDYTERWISTILREGKIFRK